VGTTVRLRCERCTGTTDVELKDITVHEASMSVSFQFRCAQCGFERGYIQVAPEDYSHLLVPTEGLEERARVTGVSPEFLKTYVYPPDVMRECDLERRKIFDSQTKQDLKSARQSYPEEKDGWWCVYKVPSKRCEIWFNRNLRSYRLLVEAGETILAESVVKMGDEYAKLA